MVKSEGQPSRGSAGLLQPGGFYLRSDMALSKSRPCVKLEHHSSYRRQSSPYVIHPVWLPVRLSQHL